VNLAKVLEILVKLLEIRLTRSHTKGALFRG
jgi:hypothetical protein